MMSNIALLLLFTVSEASAAWQSSTTTTTRKAVSARIPNVLSLRTTNTRLQRARSTTTSTNGKANGAASDDTTIPIQLNPMLDQVQPSKTVELFSLVQQMQSDGLDVTSLCVGEPDFLPSATVLQAVKDAVDAGATRYTAVTGTVELRRAVAKDILKRKGVEYNPLTDICVSNGAKQAVFQGMLAVAGTGDAVIVPAPYWPSYPEMVRLCGAAPVIVETAVADDYLMDATTLRATLEAHPETKAIILCNPSNPTGAVYSKEKLLDLVEVLQDYPQVAVLADEIYEQLVYNDEGNVVCLASLPSMWHRTVTINGFSKAYAMTGFRLGYTCAPPHISRAITTIQGQLTSCASSVSQAAAVAALELVDDQEMQENIKGMVQKRDFVWHKLADMPGVVLPPQPPQGAFYVLPDFSSYCTPERDDAQLALDLLERHQLALVPGSSFGAPGTLRISYATSLDVLDTAMAKLSKFLEEERVSMGL